MSPSTDPDDPPSIPSTPSTIFITIPLHYIHEFLTNDSPPQVACVKKQSLHPLYQDECFLMRWELGALIAKLDPQEGLFHVELYPSLDDAQLGKPLSHAEVYTAQVWRDSMARNWKLKRPPTASQLLINHRDNAYRAIRAFLLNKRYPTPMVDSYANLCANYHLTVNDQGTILDVTDIAKQLGVSHILAQLETDLKSATPTVTTNDTPTTT